MDVDGSEGGVPSSLMPYLGITPHAAIQAQSLHNALGYTETRCDPQMGLGLSFNGRRSGPRQPGASRARDFDRRAGWSIPMRVLALRGRVLLGRTTGSASTTLTPLFQALPRRASSSTVRSCRRTQHWHRPAGSFASPTGSHYSPSSTASSPRTHRLTGERGRSDTGGKSGDFNLACSRSARTVIRSRAATSAGSLV